MVEQISTPQVDLDLGVSEFLKTESMSLIAQQSDGRSVRNYKLTPVKCIQKNFCVEKVNTQKENDIFALLFTQAGQTTTQIS